MNESYNFDELIDRENSDCVKLERMKELFGRDDLIPLWVADMDFRSPPRDYSRTARAGIARGFWLYRSLGRLHSLHRQLVETTPSLGGEP